MLPFDTSRAASLACRVDFTQAAYANINFLDQDCARILFHLSLRRDGNLLVINRRDPEGWRRERVLADVLPPGPCTLQVQFALGSARVALDGTPVGVFGPLPRPDRAGRFFLRRGFPGLRRIAFVALDGGVNRASLQLDCPALAATLTAPGWRIDDAMVLEHRAPERVLSGPTGIAPGHTGLQVRLPGSDIALPVLERRLPYLRARTRWGAAHGDRHARALQAVLPGRIWMAPPAPGDPDSRVLQIIAGNGQICDQVVLRRQDLAARINTLARTPGAGSPGAPGASGTGLGALGAPLARRLAQNGTSDVGADARTGAVPEAAPGAAPGATTRSGAARGPEGAQDPFRLSSSRLSPASSGDTATGAGDSGGISALEDDTLTGLQAIEHVRFAGIWPLLDPVARAALTRLADHHGLGDFLFAGHAPEALPPPCEPGARLPYPDGGEPVAQRRDRQRDAVTAALRAATDSPPGGDTLAAGASQSIRTDTDALLVRLQADDPLPPDARRALLLSLSEALCCHGDPRLLWHRARAEGLAPFAPGDTVWHNSAVLPLLYCDGRWQDLTQLLWRLAPPQPGWLVTPAIAWVARAAAEGAPDGQGAALPEARREAILHAFLGLIGARAVDYWDRAPCAALTDAAVALMRNSDTLSDALRRTALAGVLRVYGLSPRFHAGLAAGSGPGSGSGSDTALPARLHRAMERFARLEALIMARDAGSGGAPGTGDPAQQIEIAAILDEFERWGTVDVPRFRRDLLGPAGVPGGPGAIPDPGHMARAPAPRRAPLQGGALARRGAGGPADPVAGAMRPDAGPDAGADFGADFGADSGPDFGPDEAALRWMAFPRAPGARPVLPDTLADTLAQAAARAVAEVWADVPRAPHARLLRALGQRATTLLAPPLPAPAGRDARPADADTGTDAHTGTDADSTAAALTRQLMPLTGARDGWLGFGVGLALVAGLGAGAGAGAGAGVGAGRRRIAGALLDALGRAQDTLDPSARAAMAGSCAPVMAAFTLQRLLAPGDPLRDRAQALFADLCAAARPLLHPGLTNGSAAAPAGALPAPCPAANPLFDTLVVVMSCRPYLDSRVAALRAGWLGELARLGVPWVVMVGGGNGRCEALDGGHLVHLDAPDDYEGLPQKTLAAIAWVHGHTPFARLLKIDDDCFVHVDAFFPGLAWMAADYHGRVLTRVPGQLDRSWHMAKARSERGRLELDKSPEPARYADGGSGYVLSRRAMAAVLRAAASPEGQALAAVSFMEDKLVGDLLALEGIGVDGTEARVAVLRRTRPGGPLVSQWENGFLPFAGAPVGVAHLDGHERQAEALALSRQPWPAPAKIWPSFQPVRLGQQSNALDLVSPQARLERAADAPVTVVAALRNEMLMLPHFLDHYRALGAGGFLIADNGSDDGTLEHLLDQPDVALFCVDTDYSRSHYGVAWQQALLSAFRVGRWSLLADADELLFWSRDLRGSLPDLVAGADFRGADAARVHMLDMYPRGPLSQADFQGISPFVQAGYVERAPFLQVSAGRGPYSDAPTFTSALRHRLLPGSRAELFVAQKLALLKYRPWMRLSDGLHFVAHARLARRELLFGHFKYNAAFRAKARLEVARRQHFNNAEEYAKYLALVAEGRETLYDPAASVPWQDCAFVRALCGS